MNSVSFRKWLTDQGCRFDKHEHQKRQKGHAMVTVHRDGRKTEIPLQRAVHGLGRFLLRTAGGG